MLKETYRLMNKNIVPSEKLIHTVLHEQKEKNHHKKAKRKKAVIVFAMVFCLLTVIPVFAVNIPTVYELMYQVSPTVAQFFKPVQQSSVDNGIKMEVLSSYTHDNVAEIYITLQDQTDDRVDETTDLYDSYSIHRPFDSMATCRQVGYEKKTKTATFLISITEWGNKKIAGDKITFSLREFLSHKTEHKGMLIPLELDEVDVAKSTQKVDLIGAGGVEINRYLSRTDETVALLSGTANPAFPVFGIELSAIGYVEGRLHIQTRVYHRLENDNHGGFYLQNDKGNKRECDYNFYFLGENEKGERIDYCEYVFDLPKEDLQNFALYGNFVTSGMITKGNWQITFALDTE